MAEVRDGLMVAVEAVTHDCAYAYIGEHRHMPKVLTLANVGDVHLYYRRLDGCNSVAD